MKRGVLISLVAAIIVAVGLVWFLGASQELEKSVEPESSSSAENEVTETLTTAEAAELADKIVSQDEMTYAAAWSHEENIPPISPEGTTIVVNTVESGGDIAVIDVTFTMPDAETADYYLLVQLVGEQWRIYTMREK